MPLAVLRNPGLLPAPSSTSIPFWRDTLPPHLLHTHHSLLPTPSSVSKTTSYRSVSVTLEKGSEIPCFAGMVNVSVRCHQLHPGLFAPNIPIGSGITERGRRNWREGRQCRAFPDAYGKVPKPFPYSPEGAPLLL